MKLTFKKIMVAIVSHVRDQIVVYANTKIRLKIKIQSSNALPQTISVPGSNIVQYTSNVVSEY
jgi:hypothetical protein